MENLRGLNDLLPFLNFLKRKRVSYRLDHERFDALMVSVTLLGERFEIDFFEDHIEYSRFTGDESVQDDQATLFRLIADFAD